MQRTVRSSAAAHSMVALLRAVNVGGRAVIRMADLTSLVAKMGYVAPRALLQSGNIVFGPRTTGRSETTGQIEGRLETELLARLTLTSVLFVRTAGEWTDIVAANPFTAEADGDPRHLLLMVLKDAPPASAVNALRASIKGRERVRADGRQLYMVYPDGVGHSKLTHAIVERALATTGTARNWNTVLKLQALVSADEG